MRAPCKGWKSDNRFGTLAVLAAAATTVALAAGIAGGLERRVIRGESMKPALSPRDTVVVARRTRLTKSLVRPRVGRIALVQLPWEHDRVGVKRLVAGPGQPWSEGADSVAAGPGWVAVGDERVLSTDSRHHGRIPDEAVLGLVVARIPAPPPRHENHYENSPDPGTNSS